MIDWCARMHAICISGFGFYFRQFHDLVFALLGRQTEVPRRKCVKVSAFLCVVMVLTGRYFSQSTICISVSSFISDILCDFVCYCTFVCQLKSPRRKCAEIRAVFVVLRVGVLCVFMLLMRCYLIKHAIFAFPISYFRHLYILVFVRFVRRIVSLPAVTRARGNMLRCCGFSLRRFCVW